MVAMEEPGKALRGLIEGTFLPLHVSDFSANMCYRPRNSKPRFIIIALVFTSVGLVVSICSILSLLLIAVGAAPVAEFSMLLSYILVIASLLIHFQSWAIGGAA